MTYFTCTNNGEWQKTNAKSLPGAKRAAQKRCIFQGQTVRVGIGEDENAVVEIARLAADPIDMRLKGRWVEV